MDGNRKKEFWRFVIVLIAVLLSFFSGCWMMNRKWKDRIEQVEGTVKELESQRDSLMKRNEMLDEQMSVLIDSLKMKKEKIVYIKIKGNEKVDSIRALPVDNAIEFLSRELSKEAGAAR